MAGNPSSSSFPVWLCIGLISAGAISAQAADDEGTGVSSTERQVQGDAQQTYFLLAPAQKAKPPQGGYGLLLILPGGDGSAAFRPFVSNLYAQAVPAGFLAAQLVAPRWSPDQKIVWPTRQNKVAGQKFSTEDFIAGVVADVKREYRLDPRRVFTLSWSSGGPAAYAASLAPDTPVTGSYIAMSVFKPEQLPPLAGAKGRAYYIYHSQQDRVCPIRMATQAGQLLKKNGAETRLVTYQGGHGWTSGNVFGDIRAGLVWLVAASDRPPASAPATRSSESQPALKIKTPGG